MLMIPSANRDPDDLLVAIHGLATCGLGTELSSTTFFGRQHTSRLFTQLASACWT